MKLIEQKIGEIKSSGVEHKGTFKANLNSFAFEILSSKIYSRPIEAVVRELSCNAVDAHKEAGTLDIPYIIHVPSQYEPYFSIRDYGTGLTSEEIETIYTTYFESTKSHSNDFIGCFGLGSKTPFAVTDQFNVSSFKNGRVQQYNLYKNELGIPSVAKIYEGDTDEQNGLYIEVPVNLSQKEEYKNVIKKIFKYFDHKPILTNDVIEFNQFNIDLQGDGWILEKEKIHDDNRYATAIMGSISYPITCALTQKIPQLNLFFNLGDLSFHTSREVLQYDEKTNKIIREKYQLAFDQIKKLKLQEINQIQYKWQQNQKIEQINRDGFYWLHLKLNSILEKIDQNDNIHFVKQQRNKRSTLTNKIYYSGKTIIIEQDNPKFIYLERIKQYLASNHVPDAYIIPTAVLNKYLSKISYDPNLVIKLSSLPKKQRIKNTSQTPKIKIQYKIPKSSLKILTHNGIRSVDRNKDLWPSYDDFYIIYDNQTSFKLLDRYYSLNYAHHRQELTYLLIDINNIYNTEHKLYFAKDISLTKSYMRSFVDIFNKTVNNKLLQYKLNLKTQFDQSGELFLIPPINSIIRRMHEQHLMIQNSNLNFTKLKYKIPYQGITVVNKIHEKYPLLKNLHINSENLTDITNYIKLIDQQGN